MEEQRRAPRFRASIPVEVGDDGGLTIDISSSGIAFDSDRSYQIGQKIPLRLVLGRNDSPFAMNLQCTGEVVRVEQSADHFIIGAAIEWLDQDRVEYTE